MRRFRRLICTPGFFLDQLHRLDMVRLVARGAGLSFSKRTSFGLFEPWRSKLGVSLIDSVSGLAVFPEEIDSICLGPISADRPPALELGFRRSGFAIAVYPERTATNRDVIRWMIRSFSREISSREDPEARGAGAWLDDWRSSCVDRTVLVRSGRTGVYRASVSADGFEAGIAFRPVFFDHDGGICRLASAGGSDAIVAESRILATAPLRLPTEVALAGFTTGGMRELGLSLVGEARR